MRYSKDWQLGSRLHTCAAETRRGGNVIDEPRSQGCLIEAGTTVGQSMGPRKDTQLLLKQPPQVKWEEEKYPGFPLPPTLQPPNSAAHWPFPAGSQLRTWEMLPAVSHCLQTQTAEEGEHDLRERHMRTSRPRTHAAPELHHRLTLRNHSPIICFGVAPAVYPKRPKCTTIIRSGAVDKMA